jgi:hypothetical protein
MNGGGTGTPSNRLQEFPNLSMVRNFVLSDCIPNIQREFIILVQMRFTSV